MKKEIRIKFLIRRPQLKVWYSDFFVSILSKRFIVVIDEENPDFIFHEAHLIDVVRYSGIRIAFAAENNRIDFNISDYGIGFDRLQFLDRYLRFPLYLLYRDVVMLAEQRNLNNSDPSRDLFANRKFCNFLVSNGDASEFRSLFFHELSKYRKVDSGGHYLNNVGFVVKHKLEWQKKYKFSLCFENSSTNGYLTEKLIEAYAANTVPIYWGDEAVFGKLEEGKSGINRKAIIWIDQKNTKEGLELIIKLDQDSDLYIAYLNQPLFLDSDHSRHFLEKLDNFLAAIFDQNLKDAYRRGFGLSRLRVEKRTTSRSSLIKSFVNYLKRRIKF